MTEAPAPFEVPAPHRALTGVRFFAALWVLLFHAVGPLAPMPQPPSLFAQFVSLGYIAVSFFFLLSGYILTVSYLGNKRSLTSPRNFLIARFARIYPLYLLTLLLDTPDWFVSHASGFGGYRHALVPTGSRS